MKLTTITYNTTWTTTFATSKATSKSTTTSWWTEWTTSYNTLYTYSRSTTRNTTYSKTTSKSTQESAVVNINYATSWNTTVNYTTSWTTYYSYNTNFVTQRETDDGLSDCIVEGSWIHVSETETVKIEDLQLNEPILTMDGPHNIEIEQGLGDVETTTIADNLSYDDKLVAARKTYAIGIIDINNGLIKSTPHHLHIVKKSGKWVARQAQTVEVGDYLYHITDGEILVTSVTEDTTNTYAVYKLDVEPNDIFFANGILTHNRKPELCFEAGGPEICDPQEICYDPCHPNAWQYGCQFECQQG